MNRRTFLKFLGVIAAMPSVIAKAFRKPPVMRLPIGGLTIEKMLAAKAILEANEYKDHAAEFTERLEAEGKLAFTETIDVMPTMAHCIHVRHVHAGKVARVNWVDADADLNAMLPKIREQTKVALRRYWARQIRWKRKAQLAMLRA